MDNCGRPPIAGLVMENAQEYSESVFDWLSFKL